MDEGKAGVHGCGFVYGHVSGFMHGQDLDRDADWYIDRYAEWEFLEWLYL